MLFSKKRKVAWAALCLVFLVPSSAFAQLSDLHYLPPLKQQETNIGFSSQAIFLSTPETSTFNVYVYRGTSTDSITTIALSNASPAIYTPSGGVDNNITFVDYTNTGVVLSNSGLRFESENGERFYVNHRGDSTSQGSSLTSKGRAALGKRFRWGGAPVIKGKNTNATLGIMATEDGTTVTISDYDPAITFRQGNNENALEANTLTISLDEGQSYVLEHVIGGNTKFPASQEQDKWMGASIVADKDIAVSLGNALYSSTSDNGRDIAIDQIIPENVLGNEYVFVRGYGNDDMEFAVIIATQNDTEIYINDALTPVTTIDAGEYYIVKGDNYSGTFPGNGATNKQGENMYVRTSKQAYAYHSTAGANSGANVDYNFVAPVNFLLDKEVDFIPGINELAGNKTISGGITIISAASTPDEELDVYVDGNLKSKPPRKAVNGTDLWVTYFIDGLDGDVKVQSTNSIAVGFLGQSGVVGVSGYFSGFETIPSIDVDVSVIGDCLQDENVALTAPNGYAIYQWYKEGEPVSGGTQRTLIPSLPGSYTVGVTQSEDGKEFVSAPVDVSDCLPEIKLDVTTDQQSLTVNQSTALRVNYKYQSFFNAENAKVELVIPNNFQVTANNPSVGQWSDETNTWTLGTVSPGDERALELTLEAVTTGDPVTVTATNSQTVKGSDNTTVLAEGNSIPDDLSESFTIKNATVITIASPINKTVLDEDFNLGASSNNPNPITYQSSDLGVARVLSDGTVEIRSAGSATFTLSQQASETFGPGTKDVVINVTKVSPVLSDFPDINKVFGEPNFQINPPTTASDGVFSYASDNSTVASVDPSSGVITINQAGTATITASQAATDNFNAASITATLTVTKADQQILVGQLPDEKTILQLVGPGGDNSPISISATATSGLDVTISLPAGSIGSLSGTPGSYQLDSVSGPGNLVIDFSIASSTNYNAASKSITLDVSKRTQTITFSPAMPVSATYNENLVIPITATAPASAPMAFNVVSGPATLSNGQLEITGAGVVTYSVDNPGDDIFTAAPQVINTLSVSKGTTELSGFSIQDKSFGDSDFTVPVPSSNRSGTFTYTSSDPAVASIDNGVISVNNLGTVTITATQEATDNWTRESIAAEFDVSKGTPVISGLSSLSRRTIDPDFVYSVVSTAPSLPIEFRSSDLSVATVDPTTGLISIKGIGTAEITASQSATENYNAASKVLTLTVTKANPTITSPPDIKKLVGEKTKIPTPTSDSGGAFKFSTSDTDVISVDPATGEVVAKREGVGTVSIEQAPTARYNQATASVTVTGVLQFEAETVDPRPPIAVSTLSSPLSLMPLGLLLMLVAHSRLGHQN